MKSTDLSKLWSPCLYIENALSEQKDSSWQTAGLNERGEAYISERRKLRGVFLENLELQNFPLDVQDLSVTVVSERQDSEVEIVADEEDPSSVNVGTFADEQEWKLYQHVEVTKKTVRVEFANQQRTHSAIQVTCRAARRPGYFYYNVFLVMVSDFGVVSEMSNICSSFCSFSSVQWHLALFRSIALCPKIGCSFHLPSF